jgi:hypothetical protein
MFLVGVLTIRILFTERKPFSKGSKTMCKLYRLGMLTILLSLVASPVFAGNEPLCDPLKDGASKGLYGLCIAYHNAGNTNARQRISDNYDKKAGPGDPPMPGTERKKLTCPCLDAISVVGAGIEDWGFAVSCSNDGDGTDQGIFVNPALLNLTTFFTTTSDGVVHMCDIDQSPATFVTLAIDATQYEECLTQLLMLCI